jgi:glycosyltransferase involved in cell wall biosynthesis
MDSKILIIAYTFPPKPGIGGRRWAKFAKYLNKKDVDFSVITSNNLSNTESNWMEDTALFRDKIHVVNSNYPKHLQTVPTSVLKKISYRFSLVSVKYRTRGNFYDNSSFWYKSLIPKAIDLIEQGYTTIIATGAPFKYLHDLLVLKEAYPSINLIADIRDLWLHDTDLYGYNSLNEKRYRFEEKIKSDIVEQFDTVITVNKSITLDFSKRYPAHIDKFKTIENGFDLEDFQQTKNQSSKKSTDKLTFLFAGTFYRPAIYLFDELIKALHKYKNDQPTQFDMFEFKFIGHIPEELKIVASDFENIEFSSYMPLEKIQNEIQNADIMMLFLMDEMNYSKSTKFFEYVANQRPILVFANGGIVGEEVESEKIGYFAKANKVYETLVKIGLDFENDNLPKTIHYNIEKNNLEYLTNELIKEIESLYSQNLYV